MSKYIVRMADEQVARLAARNVAEDEYWYRAMDSRKWARTAVLADILIKDGFRTPENGVFTTTFCNTPVAHREMLVEIYCQLREEDIYTDAIDHGNPDLVREIRRVKYIVKMYTKHHKLDLINSTSRHSSKYILVLLISILVTTLLIGV